MPKRRVDTRPTIIAVALVFLGIVLFLFGTQLATYTNTNLNYSALGGFVFLAGLIVYLANRPQGRRR